MPAEARIVLAYLLQNPLHGRIQVKELNGYLFNVASDPVAFETKAASLPSVSLCLL